MLDTLFILILVAMPILHIVPWAVLLATRVPTFPFNVLETRGAPSLVVLLLIVRTQVHRQVIQLMGEAPRINLHAM
jgi:hypothetical protein